MSVHGVDTRVPRQVSVIGTSGRVAVGGNELVGTEDSVLVAVSVPERVAGDVSDVEETEQASVLFTFEAGNLLPKLPVAVDSEDLSGNVILGAHREHTEHVCPVTKQLAVSVKGDTHRVFDRDWDV